MSSFDFNKPTDFAAATLSPLAGALNGLTGRNDSWDIVEGSYNNVLFHIFKSSSPYQAGLSSISDSGGRRKVKYVFPYVDGQTTDDLGRKPASFEINVLLSGPDYKTGLALLVREFQKPTPGILRHPVLGQVQCVVEDYQLTHSNDARKAVAMRVQFIEHNFSVGKITVASEKDPTLKSALLKALQAVKAIDTIIGKVQANVLVFQTLKNQLNAILTSYKDLFTTNLQNINQTFNNGSSVDLPTLLPVNEGGIGGTQATTFPVAVSPTDPFANITTQPSSALSVAVATQQAVNQVNATRAQCEAIIVALSDANNGDGAFIFYDDILSLRQGAITLQDTLEKGVQSSRAQVIQYTTPRLMSVREVAFAVGLAVDNVYEIEQLNPSLLSVNYIAKGTALQVPIS